jgi:large subunit ribosomal protein L31e
MAEQKQTPKQEGKEYTIPLRQAYLKVPQYRRGGKAIKTIKAYIAKHMKIPDRDTKKIKLDIYLNNEVLFKGRKKPPAKIKVKAIKDEDNIKVTFVETPQHVKFLKVKHSKQHKKPEKKAPETPTKTAATPTVEQPLAPQTTTPPETKEQTPEQKKEEKEKEQSVAQERAKQAEQQAKAEKHTAKGAGPQVQRKALKK